MRPVSAVGRWFTKRFSLAWPRFRIVHVPQNAPCPWQLQERVWGIFWKNSCGSVSSATTAAHEILHRIGKL